MPCPDLRVHLSKSIYETRGWTLQERLLSTRSLFLTKKAAIFQCSTHVMPEFVFGREDANERIFAVNPLGGTYGSAKVEERVSDVSQHLAEYQGIIRRYSRRKLTHQSDIFLALTGMMRIMEQRGLGTFLYGISESYLDLGLLWVGGGSGCRRSMTDLTGSGNYIPSWSWAGWTTPVGDFMWMAGPNEKAQQQPQVHSTIFDLFVHGKRDGRRAVRRTVTDLISIPEGNSTATLDWDDQILPYILPGTLEFRARTLPLAKFQILSEKDVGRNPYDRTSYPRYYLYESGLRLGILEFAEPWDFSSCDGQYDLILLSFCETWARHAFPDDKRFWDEEFEDTKDLERTSEELSIVRDDYDDPDWQKKRSKRRINENAESGEKYTHCMLLVHTIGETTERIGIGLMHDSCWWGEAVQMNRIFLS